MTRRGFGFCAGGFGLALAIGWLLFPALLYKREAQPLQFSHLVHTGDKAGMSCGDCHTVGEDGRFEGIPSMDKCGTCHSSQLGESEAEKVLVDDYIGPGKPIPWLVYLRQPDNAYFPHGIHMSDGTLKCEQCHGQHGKSESLRAREVNRISGYSRDVWGRNMSGISLDGEQGMKMDRCIRCHARLEKREGCIACHK